MTALLDFIDPIARTTIQMLLNSLWQGIALTAVVWCLLWMIRRANATTRYMIWYTALAAVICLPISAGWHWSEPASRANTDAPVGPAFEQADSILTKGKGAVYSTVQDLSDEKFDEGSAVRFEADQQRSAAPVQVGDESQPAKSNFPIEFFSGRWSIFSFAGWLLVTLGMVGRLIWSYSYLRRLKRSCTPLSELFQNRLKQNLSAIGIDRSVRLCSSSDIHAPVAIGLMSPVILIPETMEDLLTEAEFDQIVLHELAHIARRDDWTNLAQKLIQAILFFHPAVWWIGRQLSLEREIACDDYVISVTGRSKPYAACLIKLVELTRSSRSLMLAPGAVMSRRQLSRRVEVLLDKRRDSTLRLSRAGLLVTAALLTVAVAIGAMMSPVIALVDQPLSLFDPDDQPLASVQQTSDKVELITDAEKNYERHRQTADKQDVELSTQGSIALVDHTGGDTSSGFGRLLTQENNSLTTMQFETPPRPDTNSAQSSSVQTAPVSKANTLWWPQEAPHAPVAPVVPQTVPLPPLAPPSLPAAPSGGPKELQEYERQKALYEEQMRKYRAQMKQYDEQMKEYRKQIEHYHELMRQYEKEMKQYDEQMKKYNEEMRRFEKQIFGMMPGVVLRLLSEEIAKLDVNLDVEAQARFDSAVGRVAATVAGELIYNYKDLKINRPEGRIILVSFFSASALRAKLRGLLDDIVARLDIELDATMRSKLHAAMDRVAPALQSLVVYKS